MSKDIQLKCGSLSPEGVPPLQSCCTVSSTGTYDCWRQLPDLFILHCHLLLQYWRWCSQGLPGDVRDALGPRRGEFEGFSSQTRQD